MEAFIEGFAKHGYLAVFVLMLLESACIPIPSEVTMLFAGFLASPDHPTDAVQLNFVVVALMGVAGNVVGSWLAYGVGRAVGRTPLDRWGKYVGIRAHDIDKAERWWAKRGTAAVFFSRMLPVVRTFISVPAGIVRMPIWQFTIYTFAGALPWCIGLTYGGYKLGENYEDLRAWMRPVDYPIAAIIAALFAWYVYRHVKRAWGEGGAEAVDAEGTS